MTKVMAAHIDLNKINTLPPEEVSKKDIKENMPDILDQLDKYQNLLYAENKHAVLIVLQGMDASGKDGAIKKVFSALNPQGVSVTSFKVPTAEELAHDFLWRIHKKTPSLGMIGIFNRSHYEDVLVTRVHGLIDDKKADENMEAINNFEALLTKNQTHILKFYLHVSAEEQQERLKERMINEEKMWKYNAKDFQEAKERDSYLKYYNEVFRKCNHIPWNIIPADKNWYKEYLIAKTLLTLFKSLKMKYPVLDLGERIDR